MKIICILGAVIGGWLDNMLTVQFAFLAYVYFDIQEINQRIKANRIFIAMVDKVSKKIEDHESSHKDIH